MPIPDLQNGLLPPGVHDCSIEEARARFGSFQGSDRRPRLFAKLEQYLNEVRTTRLVARVVLDGSFVTAIPDPNDIDLVLLLRPGHDFSAALQPFEYKCPAGRTGPDALPDERLHRSRRVRRRRRVPRFFQPGARRPHPAQRPVTRNTVGRNVVNVAKPPEA